LRTTTIRPPGYAPLLRTKLCKADDILVTVIVIVRDLTYGDPRMIDHVYGTSTDELVSFQHVQDQILHRINTLNIIHSGPEKYHDCFVSLERKFVQIERNM